MVSLLLLNQLYKLSDESIVERWLEKHYYQFFSGETVLQWEFPRHPTGLVYFRKGIGEEGVKEIFKVSFKLHGKKVNEAEVLVDATFKKRISPF